MNIGVFTVVAWEKNGLAVGLDPTQAWIWVSLQTWMLPNSQWKESGFIRSGMKGAAFRWLLEEEERSRFQED